MVGQKYKSSSQNIFGDLWRSEPPLLEIPLIWRLGGVSPEKWFVILFLPVVCVQHSNKTIPPVNFQYFKTFQYLPPWLMWNWKSEHRKYWSQIVCASAVFTRRRYSLDFLLIIVQTVCIYFYLRPCCVLKMANSFHFGFWSTQVFFHKLHVVNLGRKVTWTAWTNRFCFMLSHYLLDKNVINLFSYFVIFE